VIVGTVNVRSLSVKYFSALRIVKKMNSDPRGSVVVKTLGYKPESQGFKTR
jgi:hypothetical protein